MNSSEEIKSELKSLVAVKNALLKFASNTDDTIEFGSNYQLWYSKAIKIVEALAPERLVEFKSYYLIDPKRKQLSAETYTIQDYVKGIGARTGVYNTPLWDVNNCVQVRVMNQIQILASLETRIDSVIQDVTGHLFSELQDKELEAASQLMKINVRAAGALAGVVLERHLQRVAKSHGITLRKKAPAISDLNDPLKEKSVYGIPIWRKIQYLADLRNICSHQKSDEPTKEQVKELLDGVNSIVKTVF